MRYLFSLLIFFFFPIQSVFAQTDWVIPHFESDIMIQADGTVLVGEKIYANFKDLEKHGIYRDIPLVYEDENGQKTYTKVAVNLVTQDGKIANYKVTKNDNNLRIRIGDSARTINGIHYYEITYTATGVLRTFTDHDELYWNVTGNAWEADIETASATITVPKERIIKSTCFEGYTGYTNPCSIGSQTPTSVTFTSTRSLPQKQGLTVVVGYTKGMVPILTVPPPKRIEQDIFTPLSLTTFFITLICGIGGIVFLWMKKGRDFWYRTRRMLDPNAKEEVKPLGAHETIVVEFEPPENLRPAEIGVLMDEKADTLDITATIIDLANRGFLTITELPKKWLFGSIDYELQRTENKNNYSSSDPELAEGESRSTDSRQARTIKDLLPYEKLLLDRLFTSKTVKMSSLKTTFYDDLAEVKKKLYQQVMDKKLFASHPETTRTKYLGIGFAIIVLGAILLFVGFQAVIGPVVTSGVGIIISGILFLFASARMPRRSAIGHDLYQRTKGYILFINGAEKYRQQFYEKKNMFNEILPYAIVFGLTGKFAKAMKNMGVTPTQPNWYSGTHVFTPIIFASNIDSFSKSLSSAIASTPSKSGGFSGGSSGGGFGGGGGGSW